MPARGWRRYNPAECLFALQEAAEDLGHVPTRDEYAAYAVHRLVPSARCVYNYFGGWGRALSAAGLG